MARRRSGFSLLAILVLVHLYIGFRLLPGMNAGFLGMLVGIVLLALSAGLVRIGLVAPSLRRSRWSGPLAWTGLLAMGFFSSLLVLTVVRDVLLLVLTLAGAGGPAIVHDSAVVVPLLALAVTVVGFINARRLARVVRVDVPIPGLPRELDGYAIAQISDIHVGPTIKRAYLNAIVNKVNSLKPDAIAVTGDLVDGSVQRLALHTEPLARLSAPDGAFFVTGNHEYYSGADQWIAEVRRLGLRVLLNEHVIRRRGPATLMIAGVTDYTAQLFNPAHKSDPHQAAAGAPEGVAVKVLLAHQPRSAPAAADAGFDLQLSGHTHGGQFFPWNLFVPLQQPFVAGLNRVRSLWVYTSRGTGYWGPPKRFGAPSEITLVRLVPA
ncbi:serine/threonine protein phosphatase [Massilia sp. WF1]|uniref:metallophosphoesterase n=1 Tax=unclassified Massilia TaxID=2609279 RepID=UPI00064945A1|nr:metallophosphoesterase [Massilia sp. WG5]ALK96961.1 serine/threonine protein phosphatase [Massilia sp. WG5]KLU37913.1 serine/threonine protein phosphatase [Massilia sp. WF1]